MIVFFGNFTNNFDGDFRKDEVDNALKGRQAFFNFLYHIFWALHSVYYLDEWDEEFEDLKNSPIDNWWVKKEPTFSILANPVLLKNQGKVHKDQAFWGFPSKSKNYSH